MKNMKKKQLLMTTLLSAATLGAFSSPAMAQDSAGDSADEEIIVTGSRIQRANVVASSPVVTVDAELFDARGTTDTIDLINTLPSAFAAQTTAFANGATGTSTVDLRGLGSRRTLVLVDGKRLPPGGPLGGIGSGFSADLNLIAPQLVDRVEVVTGGASAVYGSDAIAGVVNFITRKDFEGIELDVQYGFNQSNNNDDFWRERLEAIGETPADNSVTDNDTIQFSAIMGTSLADGRGNLTGFFNYSQNDGIQQGNRDFAQCATFPIGDDDLICLGSNQGPFPTTFVLSQAVDASGNPIGLLDGAGNPLLNADGSPQVSGAFSLGQDDSLSAGFNNAFNFNPFNPIRREVERFNAGFNGYYDINEDVTGYMDFAFTSSSSPQVIAPSAAFGSTINQVNCDNPVLTSEARSIICGNADINGPFPRAVLTTDFAGNTVAPGLYAQTNIRRRFVEGGPRTDDRTRTNFRMLGGFRGELIDTFDWDVFASYSETRLQRVQFNQVTLANLQQALDIVTDPVTGAPVCRNSAGGCVPFTSAYANGVPSDPSLRAFVDTPTLTTGSSAQTVVGGTIGGELGNYGLKSPYADEDVSLLVGFEYRKDELFEQADGIASSGNLVGSGGATLPTNGETSIFEVFGEAQIPVISGVQGIEQFNLTAALRYSDFSSRNNLTDTKGEDQTNTTYALGASWVPVDDIRIRAQYQRASRAPNVLELFQQQNSGLTNLTDPCSGSAPTATAAQCANTGLNQSLFGLVPPDSGQLNTLTGGNPSLSPETSDTYTIGVVYQPSQIDGLTVSLDYFDITLKDQVNTIPTSTTLSQCLTTGDPSFCNLIQRGPDGSLTFFPRELAFIAATQQNIAEFATTGLDMQVVYNHDLGSYGDVSFNYNATYLMSLDQINLPGTPSYDCVGFYNADCGSPNFEYRHNFQATWQTPWNVRATALWRYFSAVDQLGTANNGPGQDGSLISLVDDGGRAIDEKIDATGYLDLAAFYDITDDVTLRAGVNNVLDNDPPIVTTFGTTGVTVEANTVAGVYDAGGRFLFVGANMRF